MTRFFIGASLIAISFLIVTLWGPSKPTPPASEDISTPIAEPIPVSTDTVATSTETLTNSSSTTSKTKAEEIQPAESATAEALPTYTKETLARYNGEDPNLPIYIAFESNVYDVTEGRKFYEPGGSYHFLAGTDGTLLLRTFGGDLIKQKYPVVGTYLD